MAKAKELLKKLKGETTFIDERHKEINDYLKKTIIHWGRDGEPTIEEIQKYYPDFSPITIDWSKD